MSRSPLTNFLVHRDFVADDTVLVRETVFLRCSRSGAWPWRRGSLHALASIQICSRIKSITS